jgi:hypothetical protein
MLLADKTYRHNATFTVGQGVSENTLSQKNALCVMPQGSVTKVCNQTFAFIKPAMNGYVICWRAAILTGRANTVIMRMSHYGLC